MTPQLRKLVAAVKVKYELMHVDELKAVLKANAMLQSGTKASDGRSSSYAAAVSTAIGDHRNTPPALRLLLWASCEGPLASCRLSSWRAAWKGRCSGRPSSPARTAASATSRGGQPTPGAQYRGLLVVAAILFPVQTSASCCVTVARRKRLG